MSVVYAAYDPELDRQVALKLMRPVEGSKTQTAERLLREAQALARLAHPHVVHVYDVGIVEGEVYVAIEFIDGVTLADWVQSETPPWRRVLEVLSRAGQGLAAAHDAGLVHLDFKPANVLIGNDGRVRVADFGLARRPRSPDSTPWIADSAPSSDDTSRDDSRPRSHLDVKLTEAGVVFGTPGYMAPEQIRGEAVDQRADVYSFGCTVYYLVAGRPPYTGTSSNELLRKHLKAAPPSLEVVDSNITNDFAKLVRWTMGKTPQERPGSLDDFLSEFRSMRMFRVTPRPPEEAAQSPSPQGEPPRDGAP